MSSSSWNFGIIKNSRLLPMDDQKYEFVFVLDRSGSMNSYSSMFLRSRPIDWYFNIIGFGSSIDPLFPSSFRNSQENLDTAVQYAEGMSANMGENEVELPLLHIYKSPGILGYMTQIFALTDGRVPRILPRKKLAQNAAVIENNAELVVESSVLESDDKPRRIWFSRKNKIAKAGNGTAEFVFENDTIRGKVLNQLKVALRSPLLKAIRLT